VCLNRSSINYNYTTRADSSANAAVDFVSRHIITHLHKIFIITVAIRIIRAILPSVESLKKNEYLITSIEITFVAMIN